jgi:hypothetical protein
MYQRREERTRGACGGVGPDALSEALGRLVDEGMRENGYPPKLLFGPSHLPQIATTMRSTLGRQPDGSISTEEGGDRTVSER